MTIETQAMPADPPPQGLRGWIERFEIEFLKRASFPETEYSPRALGDLEILRSGAKTFEAWCWLPPNRQHLALIAGYLPSERTFHEVLHERLLIVWADEMLWRIIRIGEHHSLPEPHTTDDCLRMFLVGKYQLQIPFAPSVWLEMVHQPFERAYLFVLMVSIAPRFFCVQSRNPEKDLKAEWRAYLSRDYLGDLLVKYVHNPAQDWRPELALQFAKERLPLEVLQWLRFAVNKFADDIAYIIQHPNRFDARRAPPVGHRIRCLSEAKTLEDMVVHLRQDAGLTDYGLAKQCVGRTTGACRKLAKEARQLAFYRDGIPVKLHKSRGNKNVPTTPS